MNNGSTKEEDIKYHKRPCHRMHRFIDLLKCFTDFLLPTNQQRNQQKQPDKQPPRTNCRQRKPKLISISLQYTDNRSNTNTPFLQVSGYVVNVGNADANNCTIHITAYRDGNVTALDTSASIPSLDAGAYETISVQFPYTGEPLGFYNSYLTWTN